MAADEGFEVVRLGARGDGIAEAAEGPRYLPFALPGERVRVEGAGLPELLSAPSPERRAPACRHFGVCGGCVAQHMGERLYADWKRGILEDALRKRGLRAELAPLRAIAAASRRRAVMTGRCLEEEACSATIRAAAMPPLRCWNARFCCRRSSPACRRCARSSRPRPSARSGSTVLATPVGLDVAIASARRLRCQIVGAARPDRRREPRLARVTLDGETISQRAAPGPRLCRRRGLPAARRLCAGRRRGGRRHWPRSRGRHRQGESCR